MTGKKVLIIGDEQISSYASIIKLIEENDCEVVNVYDKDWDVEKLRERIKAIQTPRQIITIGGIEYVPKPDKSSSKGSRAASKLMMMASVFGGLSQMPNIGGKGISLPPGIDIISEFKLIQEKKSKLSSRQRDHVVSQFKSRFETLEEFKERTK